MLDDGSRGELLASAAALRVFDARVAPRRKGRRHGQLGRRASHPFRGSDRGISRVMRLIAPLLILLAGPALACKFIPQTLEENIRNADSVFVGAVERAEGDFRGVKGGTAWLRVLAVHKGRERPGEVVPVSSRMGSCGTE